MNWHRIKTFAKVLVSVSFLLPTFLALYNMTWVFQKVAEGETADSVQPEISKVINSSLLLNSFMIPVMFFGVVLWIIAAGKLRRHTVNPRLGCDPEKESKITQRSTS